MGQSPCAWCQLLARQRCWLREVTTRPTEETWIAGQVCGVRLCGLRLNWDVSIQVWVKVGKSHGWAGKGRASVWQELQLVRNLSLIEASVRRRNRRLLRLFLLHNRSYHLSLNPAGQILCLECSRQIPRNRGRSLGPCQDIPSTFYNQANDKCLLFSQGFIKQVLNVSSNA